MQLVSAAKHSRELSSARTVPRVTRNTATRLADRADDSAVMISLARTGFATNGVLHILIGGIAVGLAVGVGGEADQSGALAAVASVPGGEFVLWLAAIGLIGLGVWQGLQAFIVRDKDPKKRWALVVTEVSKGIGYLAIGTVALTFALGGRHSSSHSSRALSARLLDTPGGVFLVIALGLAVFGVGAFFIWRGAVRGFTRDLSLPTGRMRRAVIVLGTVGYIANGVAVCVVGVLFVVAGIDTKPSQASGLDGALKALLALPAGPVILMIVGVGVIVFGFYFFARARYAKF
jgi:hypothetical protein